MNPNRPTKPPRNRQSKAAKKLLAKQSKHATDRLHSELVTTMTYKVRP